jgi:hypothetical protein
LTSFLGSIYHRLALLFDVMSPKKSSRRKTGPAKGTLANPTFLPLDEFNNLPSFTGRKDKIISSLKACLGVNDDAPPTKNPKGQWNEANHLGFIKGLFIHFPETVAAVSQIIKTNAENDTKRKLIEDFVDDAYLQFVAPFYKHDKSLSASPATSLDPATSASSQKKNRSRTSSATSSPQNQSSSSASSYRKVRSPSSVSKVNKEKISTRNGAISAQVIRALQNQEVMTDTSSTRGKFRELLETRDGKNCLFCWEEFELQGTHIIAQKKGNFNRFAGDLFAKCGIQGMYHITNGLLLCSICHGRFDKLQAFVEATDAGYFFVPSVNLTDAEEMHRLYSYLTFDKAKIKMQTTVPIPDKEATLQELVLYGKLDFHGSKPDEPPTPNRLPNKLALLYHKAACFIWSMAGGADPEEDSDKEGDDGDFFMDPVRGEEVSFDEKMGRVAQWVGGRPSGSVETSLEGDVC